MGLSNLWSAYRPIEGHDDQSDLDDLEKDSRFSYSSQPKMGLGSSQSLLFSKTMVIIQTILLVTCIGVLGAITAQVRKMNASCSLKDFSNYSPLFEKIPITLSDSVINGTFWTQEAPSLFQQKPSAEVDRAWDRISETHAISLTEKELRKMGKDPQENWPWPEVDAGTDAYMGLLDVFHQTHCLNILRRAIFTEYYGNLRETRKNEQFPFEQHVLHCQYILLQNIMCHADLEVITFNKIKGVKGPFADFNVQKKCRNFDDVLAWKEANQVDPHEEEWLKTPEGIIELDAMGVGVPFHSTKFGHL